MNEYWTSADYAQWVARDVTIPQLCETCDGDVSAVVEVQAYPMGDEPGGWVPHCETCYREMRAEPFSNPPGATADAYVSLGAAS